MSDFNTTSEFQKGIGAQVKLDNAILDQRKDIRSDSYPMSIGELAAMYQEGDLNLYPAFQRFFRWSTPQKTGLIESILLGIPIPSVFVSQAEDGKWDVIDGLQRLSTTFEFMGILRDANGELKPASRLEGGRLLPELAGASWDNPNGNGFVISEESKRLIKRSKLNLTIILRESTKSSKYEMFNRINSGGSSLTEQELRNCLIVMIDEQFFDEMVKIVSDFNVSEYFGFSDAKAEQSFALELLSRWMVFSDDEGLTFNIENASYDVSNYITARMMRLLESGAPCKDQKIQDLRRALEKLRDLEPTLPFQNTNTRRSFQLGLYEAFFIGATHDLEKFASLNGERWGQFKKLVLGRFAESPVGAGTRGTTRIPLVVQWGRDALKQV